MAKTPPVEVVEAMLTEVCDDTRFAAAITIMQMGDFESAAMEVFGSFQFPAHAFEKLALLLLKR